MRLLLVDISRNIKTLQMDFNNFNLIQKSLDHIAFDNFKKIFQHCIQFKIEKLAIFVIAIFFLIKQRPLPF